jgi:hypothetical protein
VHFILMVVTDEKPTNEVLSTALEPFGPEGACKWDDWVLGGRWSGRLFALHNQNTLTGDRMTKTERSIITWAKSVGLDVRPGTVRTPPIPGGVDALQMHNFKEVAFRKTFAVLKDGQWRGMEERCAIELAANMAAHFSVPESGLLAVIPEEKQRRERDAIKRWDHEWRAIMETVQPEQWIAVVDCHN